MCRQLRACGTSSEDQNKRIDTCSSTFQEEAFHEVHSRCKLGSRKIRVEAKQRLDLSSLRTCRLMYRDGTSVLWATNMFSFTAPGTFLMFMKRLSTNTSARLQQLSLSMLVREAGCRRTERSCGYQPKGGPAPKYGSYLSNWGLQDEGPFFLKALRSLQTLEIYIHHVPTFLQLRRMLLPYPREDSRISIRTLRSQFSRIQSLRTTQPRNLRISVTDEQQQAHCSELLPRRLTMAEKADLADELRLLITSREDKKIEEPVTGDSSAASTGAESAAESQNTEVPQRLMEEEE